MIMTRLIIMSFSGHAWKNSCVAQNNTIEVPWGGGGNFMVASFFILTFENLMEMSLPLSPCKIVLAI